jgi:hypothetical protein
MSLIVNLVSLRPIGSASYEGELEYGGRERERLVFQVESHGGIDSVAPPRSLETRFGPTVGLLNLVFRAVLAFHLAQGIEMEPE